ncbi:MAG TPA: hypothetical protein VHG89_06310 [Verrucomicrobiae bacterium]|nr:hypothetical protein [Verrucomicrobiae bacterium]
MSTVPDLGLDLDTLFQPAWAQGKTEANKFEKFTGNEGVKPERRGGGQRGERRGPRRENAGGGFGGGDRPRGEKKFGGKPGGKRDFRRGGNREGDRFNASTPQRSNEEKPLPELNVAFLPEEKGVEQLARQIRVTGRAYPLFQIAELILQKAERYSVQLKAKKKADGTIAQQIFVCALDDTPWLSEDEAVAHVLKNHFVTFYQTDRTPTEPPKGTYTFVAQCGMSGVILGPPNYHDYQNQLRKLHAEKFARMPFDVFKARVKIVKDETVVKKWLEEQSFKTEYTALNIAEPLKLPSLEEVEKHFRATHKDSIIKAVESHIVAGAASRNLRSDGLYRLIRKEWEHQKHFPLQVATKLSHQFAAHGLQFFKVNKMAVHVSVARPQFLDLETTPVSDGVKRIVEFLNANLKTTRKKLIESLAPMPKVEKIEIVPKTEAVAESAPAPTAEGETQAATSVPAPETKPAEQKPKSVEPTPEQTAVISDLHWLIHQGHVLEFADGRMETAKKPLPKPPKPEKVEKKSDEKVEEKSATEVTPESTTETVAVTTAEIAASTPPENLSPAETPETNLSKSAEEVSSPS